MLNIITEEMLKNYREFLVEEEKSISTISKYICDVKKLMVYANGREITRKLIFQFKENLRVKKGYKLTSINTFLIAANRLFEYLGWYGLRVKLYSIQNNAFESKILDLSLQEYRKLVMAAWRKGKRRTAMIIQTLCSMGLRVSELAFITTDSVKRGEVDIYCKRKQRKALIPNGLRKLLLEYIRESGIKSGIVFCTSSGKAVDRSNIWREMKALKDEAGIGKEKIFPHNLRHLFAKTFYAASKDIAKLADVLGHSSVETTRRYIKTTYEEHQKQIDSLGLV